MSLEKKQLALLGASAIGLCLASFWIWNYTLDDAFISFRYAQNFARGAGLVYNPGERVEGYTNFLWTVLLASGVKIGVSPLLTSKILGTLFNLLTLVVCCYLCRLAATERADVVGFSLLTTATNGAFIMTSIDGLETSLFSLLLCSAVLAYLNSARASPHGKRGRWLAGSSVLFALLALTRPDGALAFGLVWLHAGWHFRRDFKKLAVFSFPFAAIYGSYFVARWAYYGYFFPNTFYAKAGGTPALYMAGATSIHEFLSGETGGILAAGLVALWALLLPAMETTVMGLAALSRLLFQFWSGGLAMGTFRFLVPAVPLIWIMTERLLGTWLTRMRLNHRGSYVMPCLFGLLVTSQVWQFSTHRFDQIESYKVGFERAHISLGKWLKRNSPPGATVAVADIGAIGFYSGLRIVDTWGLVDTHIAHLGGPHSTRSDPGYILSHSPEYVVLPAHRCDPGPDDFVMRIHRDIFLHPQFKRDYKLVRCWDYDAGYHLLLYSSVAQPDEGISDK